MIPLAIRLDSLVEQRDEVRRTAVLAQCIRSAANWSGMKHLFVVGLLSVGVACGDGNTEAPPDGAAGQGGTGALGGGGGASGGQGGAPAGGAGGVGGEGGEGVTFVPSTGMLDTTFGGDGIVVTDYDGHQDNGRGVAVQGDGKIVVGGRGHDSLGNESYPLAVRHLADGGIDATFGTAGFAVGNSTSTNIEGAAFHSDDSFALIGHTGFDFLIARFTADGVLVPGFGTDGEVVQPLSGTDVARDAAFQSDGKLIVVGSTYTAPVNSTSAVLRYAANGELDTTFSDDGIFLSATVRFGFGVAIQDDGKLVVVGQNTGELGIYRLNVDGTVDATFDDDGVVTTALAPFGANAVALQSDNKIVVAAQIDASNLAVLRVNADGSFDTTFGTDGMVTTAGTGAEDIFVQPDGYIVLAGTVADEIALLRFTPAGVLDTTFDDDGIATADVGTAADEGFGVAMQPNGALIVVGQARYSDGEDDMLAVRYH